MKAKNASDEQNYENIAKGEDVELVSEWECVSLADCKEIVTYASNWSEIFENVITLPGEEKLHGGKDAKADWIVKLGRERNKLTNPSYSISKSTFEKISNIYGWLIG